MTATPADVPSTEPRPTYRADGTPLSIQLFTVEGTSHGPYVGLPLRDLWTPYSAHLFTRETAELIVSDMHDDECGITAQFADDGTLTFTVDADAIEPGGTVVVRPDEYGRYEIGGLWPWDEWGDHVEHTAGQAVLARGAAEYRQADDAASVPITLRSWYADGRQEALTLTRPQRVVFFDIDPARTPLRMRPRPTGTYVRRMPTGAFECAVRPVMAGEVQAGDLIVGSFSPPMPQQEARARWSQWSVAPYAAEPAGPWDPACTCDRCRLTGELFGPAPATGRLIMARHDGKCEVWDSDDIALIVPAALRSIVLVHVAMTARPQAALPGSICQWEARDAQDNALLMFYQNGIGRVGALKDNDRWGQNEDDWVGVASFDTGRRGDNDITLEEFCRGAGILLSPSAVPMELR
ncbi:hypothetical protein AB0D34_12355 [Streptomyces sp. NPDC048420]|uniref:hypothetical protein n=1 Tax=Streptomyces sp. NPDC048420 TaxID=3155755 RepID=UPI003417E76B